MRHEFPHRDKAREWIAFDPLETASEIAAENGIDAEADPAAIGSLGCALMHYAHAQKKMYLSEMGDTYYRMPWDNAVETITQQGFQIIDVYDKTTEYGTYKYLTAETQDKTRRLTANASRAYPTNEWQLDHNMVVCAVVDTHGDHKAWADLVKLGASSYPLAEYSDTDDWRFAMSWTVTDGLQIIMEALSRSPVEFLELAADDPAEY